jgi:NAD-dependent dihydropyrimidine dehydrogenase PreA subunit/nitroreductase
MNTNTIFIDKEICKECKTCIDVCPNVIFRWDTIEKTQVRPERAELCFRCGQCMSVCSTEAMKIDGLSYTEDLIPQPANHPNEEEFFNLIISRRAVRNFKDKPVPGDLLEKIVTAIKLAPPSFPPLKTELTIINNPELIKKAFPLIVNFYSYLLNALKSPIKRHFIKKDAGRETFQTLQNHLVPLLTKRLPAMIEGTEDTITRKAPAMILFHADKNSDNYRTDINIAITYGMLAAHALGLGGTVIDLVPPAVNRVKELRTMFSIPENNEVVASLILGYPKYKYRKAIKRELKSVTWV